MSKGPASVKHSILVERAVEWLRREYRCGVILSEQYCATGEVPDAIGWKRHNRSVVVECKASRSDFLADAAKPFRSRPEEAMGSERYFLAPAGIVSVDELPADWGLLEYSRKTISITKRTPRKDLRGAAGMLKEMNLVLASLRRVELRIEPQTITDFLKWKNRLAEYNGGTLPAGMVSAAEENNPHLHPAFNDQTADDSEAEARRKYDAAGHRPSRVLQNNSL